MSSRLLARGQSASPGRASGPVAFSAEAAVALAAKGTPPVLVRMETSAEDMPGLRVAAAIVTTRGGITGDGAIVARTLGKPCLVGCGALIVRYADACMVLHEGDEEDELVIAEGAAVTVDATEGAVYLD